MPAASRSGTTFQTNGVLLDDRWCEFLAANRFLVGLSIDGPRELHDKYRVDRGGAPSFDKVVRGIECLKKHGVEFNTLTVVQRDNSQHPLEVYRFLKEIGSGFLQFIPVVERVATAGGEDGLVLISPDSAASAKVTEWSVDARQYGKFLCAIFDEWVRHDVGRIFVQLFDVTLEAWVGVPSSLCVFSPTCGDALAMEHNGDVYSCDHYVYPRNRLGNVLENSLARWCNRANSAHLATRSTTALPAYCRNCDYLRACYGECPKHRFIKTPDGEPGLNYLCAAYKKILLARRPVHGIHGRRTGEAAPAGKCDGMGARARRRIVRQARRRTQRPMPVRQRTQI